MAYLTVENGVTYCVESDGTKWVYEPAAATLADAKTRKLAELNAAFNASLMNGFTSSADGTSRTYPIDPVSMEKLTSASTVINGGKVASIVIKDFNGNRVTLTSAQYQQMAADGFAFYNGKETHLWDLEDQVAAATTIDGVNAIAW